MGIERSYYNDMHEQEFEWNDIYTGTTEDYMPPDLGMMELIKGLEPGTALDIGCGSGGLVVALLELQD